MIIKNVKLKSMISKTKMKYIYAKITFKPNQFYNNLKNKL